MREQRPRAPAACLCRALTDVASLRLLAARLGQLACGLIAVIGLVVIAMPLAIVGSNFTQVWEERRLGVIALEVKKLLVQAGFSANDVFEAFALFDTDGNGEPRGGRSGAARSQRHEPL